MTTFYTDIIINYRILSSMIPGEYDVTLSLLINFSLLCEEANMTMELCQLVIETMDLCQAVIITNYTMRDKNIKANH